MSETHSIYAKDIDKLRETCDYLILHSARGTGKSYAAKLSCINDAVKNGREFIYLRRRPAETRDIDVTDYFADMDIPKITKGEYDSICVSRKRIFLTNTINGAIVRKRIGFTADLLHAADRKSLQYPSVSTLLFEEYCTDGYYLPDEPHRLLDFMSTVFRDRSGFCIMIGNKVNIFSPYMSEWCLEGIGYQKTGTIDKYVKDDTVIKVWDIKKIEPKSSLFFGMSAKSIDGDEYVVKSKNKLTYNPDEYTIKHTVYVNVDNIIFKMRLLVAKKDTAIMWYVTRESDYINVSLANKRCVSNIFNPSLLWTNGFKALSEREKLCFSFLDKIVYESDRTGTDFENAIKRLSK